MNILQLIKRIDKYLFKRRFLLLIVFTPLFWSLILSPISVIKVWFSYPLGVKTKVGQLFSEDKLSTISEMRWDSFSDERNDLSSRLFYNKGRLLVGQLLEYFSYLSPSFYFQAGDGSSLSPKGTEPILALLLPFWFVGLFGVLGDRKQKRIIKMILISSFIAFAGSKKNFALLFSVAFSYIYLSYIGIEKTFKSKMKHQVYKLIQFYGAFVILRSLYLNFV